MSLNNEKRQQFYPFYCGCLIHGADHDISGQVCKECGVAFKRGLPTYSFFEREQVEQKWWEGQL